MSRAFYVILAPFIDIPESILSGTHNSAMKSVIL